MTALYQQVYRSIKHDIINGKFKPGDRIPSEKDLAEQFQVSRITSKKAIEKLMIEGLVYRQRGKGTFVSDKDKHSPDHKKPSKKPLFGLIMTSLDASFGNELVTSLLQGPEESHNFILRVSLGIPENEKRIIQELRELGVDGIAIAPAHSEHYNSEILKMVVNKFPLVLIDRSIKGIGVTTVSTDNEAAAQMGVNYLFQLGHEHIAILMPSNYKTTSIEDRITGIVQAYAENNLIVDRQLWYSEIHSTLPYPLSAKSEDVERIKHHIQSHPKITAIFALEYNIALLAKKAVEELYLQVPNDISIICFDSTPFSDMESNFTHLKQNEQKLGKMTTKRLIDMVNRNRKIENDYIDATLIKGITTKAIDK
ncbi:GntR family transcriptional regulator [Gracilibacillus dipsosauri]|uniref:GntR family transcriptional regulator n=1 Tax=Gracilibacillus dipsosauri TaxID=178340 RepID=A0A317L0A8_9BACI|nr:GntR family transcriptional regulator [Gracilibacillus dipsosauri]PWU67279.1 GntR family transcriptional regulator [Gracilibacillus dipsosauri]